MFAKIVCGVLGLSMVTLAQVAKSVSFEWPQSLTEAQKRTRRLAEGRAHFTILKVVAPHTDYNGVSLVWIYVPIPGQIRVRLLGHRLNLSAQYERATSGGNVVLASGGYFDWESAEVCTNKGLVIVHG